MTTTHGRQPTLLRRALAAEAGMWRSLFRWISRRRPTLADDARAFGYAGVVTPIIVVFIVVSAVEIPLLDLLLAHFLPWPPLRIAALMLGAWGLIWMFGMLGTVRVHPHVTDAAGIRVRYGHSVDVSIPWSAVAEIRGRRRTLVSSSRTVEVEETGDRVHLLVGTGGQTNIDLVLREPMALSVPRGPRGPVDELRFYADDPDALIARAREHMTIVGSR
ncbi:hypothetical protein [Polymorphospora sp. NPDC050346]|uniref:hypothetical protein n=1 Tax=Polymorphospora sp. NPDC050346 TaxID=3155780 RepID=UPI003411D1A8